MSNFTVVFDACVLYPAPLRDFLMELAIRRLFHAKWTAAIHDEWINKLLQNRPELNPKNVHRTRDLMNASVRDCLVSGYEDLIDTLSLPDPDDRHVLAAAIRSRAHIILTFNLKDFPEDTLNAYGIAAQHPDDFLLNLLELEPMVVCIAAKEHRARLARPPKSVDEYLETLENQGLFQTVSRLRKFSELI